MRVWDRQVAPAGTVAWVFSWLRIGAEENMGGHGRKNVRRGTDYIEEEGERGSRIL